MVGVIAVVFGHWALTTKHALDRGIFNFDSLWYHLPFAADMAQSHSVTGMHHVDTVFTNWFYPQNSELLHADGMLLIGRDTLSLFLNYGWLAVAFLAAWCIGRPYGRGHLSVVAAAILLEAHMLVVREPGAAKNDLMAAALTPGRDRDPRQRLGERAGSAAGKPDPVRGSKSTHSVEKEPRNWAAGWVGVVAGRLAAGRRWARGRAGRWDEGDGAGDGGGVERGRDRAGAGGEEVGRRGVVVRAGPAGRRLLVPAQPDRRRQPAAGGRAVWGRSRCRTRSGCRSAGPTSASSTTRPTPSVWRHYFVPGLHDAFGALWPLVIGARSWRRSWRC